MRRLLVLLLAVLLLTITLQAQTASEIVETSGVKGGLIVVAGCDEPGLIAGLRAKVSSLLSYY